MSFATVLDAYCRALDATSREIAERCNVSPSALSRYRAGERTPEAGSEVVSDLASGIADLSREQGIAESSQLDSVLSALEVGLTGSRMVGMSFCKRLDALMGLLDIRNADMARAANVDPSYLSRIRKGQRTPANQAAFSESCSRFAARWCFDHGMLDELRTLISSAGDVAERLELDLDSESDLAEMVGIWLMGDNIVESDLIGLDRLFRNLDSFYFDERLQAADQLVIDEGPFDEDLLTPHARFYYGIEEMQRAELDFLSIASATNARVVSMSSDMPLLQHALGAKFVPRVVERIIALQRQGCHVNIIHNVDRPLSETLEVLERWIPLYMTGQVTPYYLKGVHNRLFCHVNYVCDTAALASEAVIGHEEDGRYYLTTMPDDLEYYQRKMGFMLGYSSPLLEVYREGEPGHRALFKQVEGSLRAQGDGREIAAGRYKNVRIVSYPGECVVTSIMHDPIIHFVVRHPKIHYAISHME